MFYLGGSTKIPKPQVFPFFLKGINVMPSDAISPRYHPEMVEIVKGSYTCAQNSFVTATLTENFQSCALVDGFFLVTSCDVYLHFELGVHMMNIFFGGVVWDEWSQGDYFEATDLKFEPGMSTIKTRNVYFGWWFQICFLFSPFTATRGNDSIWLIFFRWVDTN